MYTAVPRKNVTVDTTQVHNANSPTGAYANLDLRAVVGTGNGVALLRIDGVTNWCKFRKDGDTDAFKADGIGGFAADANAAAYVLVPFASGFVEWMTGAAQACTVNVEDYWTG